MRSAKRTSGASGIWDCAQHFRSYSSYAEAFTDYANLLKNNPRYSKVLEAGKGAEGEGGYARELTDEEKAQQQAALVDAIKGFDVDVYRTFMRGGQVVKRETDTAVYQAADHVICGKKPKD